MADTGASIGKEVAKQPTELQKIGRSLTDASASTKPFLPQNNYNPEASGLEAPAVGHISSPFDIANQPAQSFNPFAGIQRIGQNTQPTALTPQPQRLF